MGHLFQPSDMTHEVSPELVPLWWQAHQTLCSGNPVFQTLEMSGMTCAFRHTHTPIKKTGSDGIYKINNIYLKN